MITLDRADGLPLIVNDDGRDILVQLDWDYPGIAGTFGWSPNLYGGPCDHDGTDGTIDCPACGMKASDFIMDAGAYLADMIGATADDPGYFLTD